jgi:uncharacterized protein (TIGR00730 family)
MKLCIFCGSSSGDRPGYLAGARELGQAIAGRGFGLVYGGAQVGLMGAVADAALEAGGTVTGVIPQALMDKEFAHPGVEDLRIVSSMHERKALMAGLSDGFIALPGGIGTLEELFEVWTWGQLGEHHKPCALLNLDGYFDRLIAFLDEVVAARFLKQQTRDMLIIASTPAEVIDACLSYQAPVGHKWLTKEKT